MKKSKTTFALIAAAMVILCVILILVGTSKQGGTGLEAPQPTDAPDLSGDETLIPPTALDEIEVPPLPTIAPQPITIAKNVTIYKVDADPNEIIDRTQAVDSSHPEYLDIPGGDPYWSVEGKVCRNDKTITIEVMNEFSGDYYEITFGHITGQCNRFLYLNPSVKVNGSPASVFVHADQPTAGYLVTLGSEIPPQRPGDILSCTYIRALDQRSSAKYDDPKHPGFIWYPQNELKGPIYIDMLVNNPEGNPYATLRLTIDKAEDGTYSLADIDNLDLFQDNSLHPEFTKSELAYVIDLANEVYMSGPENSGLGIHEDDGFPLEKCIIEYREHDFYYEEFIPAGGVIAYTQVYEDLEIPFLAVHLRQSGYAVHTFYFQIIVAPTSENHGVYQYIGYDFPLYDSVELLSGFGWQGTG